MSNSSNVTAGKPIIGGGIYWAPLGTTLPTSATGSLNAAFKELGYASDAGVVNSNSPSNTAIKAWGGDTVLDVQTEKPDTFKFKLIEAINEQVAKFVYGPENVSGSVDTELKITANSKEQPAMSMVIDMLLRDGGVKRIVIPNGKVTAVGDISYVDNDATGYETTVSCYPDATGNTHYEFVKKGATPTF